MKKVLRNGLALLLCVIMVFSCCSSASAYIGELMESSLPVTIGTEKVNGVDMLYMENKYIHFAIDKSKGTTMRTTPTDNKSVNDLKEGMSQSISFTGKFRTGGGGADKDMNLSIKSAGVVQGTGGVIATDKFGASFSAPRNTIGVVYTLEDSRMQAVVTFSLVRVGKGSTSAETLILPVTNDPEDTTQDWAVLADVAYFFTSKAPDTGFVVQMGSRMTYNNPVANGHANINASARSVNLNAMTFTSQYARVSEGRYEERRFTENIAIEQGLPERDDICEVFCNDYAWANPFYSCSSSFYRGGPSYEGMSELDLPDYISYSGTTLTMRNYELGLSVDEGDIRGDTYLWGFRNLETPTEEQITRSADISFSKDASYLAVVPSGNSYKVVECSTFSDVQRQDYSAFFKTSYIKKNGSYVFTGNTAEMSPSVYASWTGSNAITLSANGNLAIAKNQVSLNTKTFKFYCPKDGGGISFAGYKKYSDGTRAVAFDIDPKKNSAVININIPHSNVNLKSAEILKNGGLFFGGDFSINTIFDGAKMDISKLSYSVKNDQLKCNGIACSGKLALTKAALFGHGASSIEGEVNTFPGEEKYAFAFSLEVANLFETNAELSIVRLKNGSLCPDHLLFSLSVEPGVDLVTPAPVVTLKGGGGGFDNLAATINKDYRAIPPIMIHLKAFGEIIKVMEGTLYADAGPSGIEVGGEDLGIKVGKKKLQIVEKAFVNVRVSPTEMVNKGVTYTGYKAGAGAGVNLSILNVKDDNDPLKFFNGTIKIDAKLGIYGFYGEGMVDNVKYGMLATELSGMVRGALCIPKGVKVIGGAELASASLDVLIGTRGVFNTQTSSTAAFKEYFKTLSCYGGIVFTGSLLNIVHARVEYIIPDTFNFSGKVGSGFEEYDWDEVREEVNNAPARRTLAEAPIFDDNEQQQGEMVVLAGLQYLADLQAGGENGLYTTTLKVIRRLVPDGEQLLVAVVPKDSNVNIETFYNSLSVSGLTLKKMTFDEETGELTNDGNARIGTYSYDEETGKITECVFISIPKDAIPVDRTGITFTSDGYDFDGYADITVPLTDLDASYNGGSLTATLTNPEPGAVYSLRTCLADANGKEFPIDCREITGTEDILIPNSGTAVESGEYAVIARLVETITGDFNNDGEEESADIPISSFTAEQKLVYTNTDAPGKASRVDVIASGNECMTGFFEPVTGADGYTIRLYEKDEDKNWVDTGRYYTYSAEDFSKTMGLDYDSVTDLFSIEMAVTSNGTSIDDEEIINFALEPDKDYRIGVSAYKNKTVEEGDTEHVVSVYGEEAFSEGCFLPESEEPEFELFYDDGTPVETEDGVYQYTTGPATQDLYLTGDDDAEYVIYKMEDDRPLYEMNAFNNTPFHIYTETEGISMWQIEAYKKNSKSDVFDKTIKYMVLTNDDVPPAIFMDSLTEFANGRTGAYSLSGSTEQGAKVKVNGSAEGVSMNADGTFTYSGTIGTNRTMTYPEKYIRYPLKKLKYHVHEFDEYSESFRDFDEVINWTEDDEQYVRENPEIYSDIQIFTAEEERFCDRGAIADVMEWYGVREEDIEVFYENVTDPYSEEAYNELIDEYDVAAEDIVLSDPVFNESAVVTVSSTDSAGNVSEKKINVLLQPAEYAVNVNEASGGGIAANLPYANEGQDVSLVYRADPGYDVKSISVTGSNEEPVTVTGGRFTMPASDVTVTAVFEKLYEVTDYDITYEWNDDGSCTAKAVLKEDTTRVITETVEPQVKGTVPATCQVKGSTTYQAVFATALFTSQERTLQDIPIAQHSFTDYVSDNNATCTKDGTKTAVCDFGCGEKSVVPDEGTATGHRWQVEYTWSKSYDNCNASFTCLNDENHTDEKQCKVVKVTTPGAICTDDGTVTATATVEFDGKTYSDIKTYSVPGKDHELVLKSDRNGHWYECECGYKEDRAAHTDADGDDICDDCGYNMANVPAIIGFPTEATIITGKSAELKADAGDYKVIYTSSDPKVAEVDENGVVTAKSCGECVITAQIEGTDVKSECSVRVYTTLWQIILAIFNRFVAFFKSILPFLFK